LTSNTYGNKVYDVWQWRRPELNNVSQKRNKSRIAFVIAGLAIAQSCWSEERIGHKFTDAQSPNGDYISWREHLIDAVENAGFNLSGSDGFVMGDLDGDGREDIVSVHESDSEYDSAKTDPTFTAPPEGHVRIAFASRDPDSWENITLAQGTDAPAPEDAAIADFNGDGHLDVIVAAELAHLIYLQNPGKDPRTAEWPRLILPQTKGKGSYIRVFAADLDGDGIPEATAPNKGAHRPAPEDYARSTPVSIFRVVGDPLEPDGWQEEVLGRYSVPHTAEPVDIDSDGDLDILVGSRGERRVVWFENAGEQGFIEHAIGVVGSGDVHTAATIDGGLVWIEQPQDIDDAWRLHRIGTFAPDTMTGIVLADINGDGHADVFAGSYSRGSRTREDDVDINDRLGRLGWFENPGPDSVSELWSRHDVSRRKRGMFDKFLARDLDGDGDLDLVSTRGNSAPFDGVFWLEQVRTANPVRVFTPARTAESAEVGLP
jgi:hypothetical protein